MKGLSKNRWGKALRSVFAIAGACALLYQPAYAQIVTLTDNNSVAQIDPGSQAGMLNWSVQGQRELFQQWFWYGIGNGGLASIDRISAPTITLTGTRGMTALYTDPNQRFSVSIDYLLSGGTGVGVGQTAVSGIGETIRIINTSGQTLPFHFYQYSDFDLGSPDGDTVQLGMNLRGLFNEAYQTDPTVGLTETVTTPGANHGEVGYWHTTRDRLNAGLPLTLNDVSTLPTAGDVTWALQWDFNIAAGGSVLISKDKFLSVLIVPEPSALAFIALGLAVFAFRRPKA